MAASNHFKSHRSDAWLEDHWLEDHWLEADRRQMPISMPSAKRRDAGIALVTVLAVTLVVLGLLTLITGLTTRSARITRTDAATTALAQLADGYSDVARVVLAENFRLARLPSGAWLDLLSSNRSDPNPTVNPTDVRVVKLAGNHKVIADSAIIGWEIKAVSAPADRPAWVTVAATAQDASGRSQTVVRRVQFDPNKIFDLAMLTEDVNCMFCHLKVNGDVGSINAFRPGWGLESDGKPCAVVGSSCGIGSGRGSEIDGDVFVRSTLSKDAPGPNLVNNAVVTGSKNENYSGERLPRDLNGATAFPGLDRVAARASAKGTLSGGTALSGVALGSTWDKRATLTDVNGFYDGNLVLDGSGAPIVLDGDVYVSGDVVIKGTVSGRGAIYAGRNVYIAGNLVNQNRADKPGAGVCKDLPSSDKSSLDKCAQANIAAGKDETRISAGNNIIMGNFTEKDAGGNQLSRRDRQAADYFRDQFALGQPLEKIQKRAVRKGSSEELRVIEGPTSADEDDSFIDQLGNAVAAAGVQRITDESVYEKLIAPGRTDQSGQFSRWLSDGDYQKLLGTETVDYGVWRTRFRFAGGSTPDRYQNSGNTSQKVADLAKELEAAGFPTNVSSEVANEIIRITVPVTSANPWLKNFDGTTNEGKAVSGTLSFDGSYLRVAMKQPYKYTTETTQLDAFLYANNRIAGKLAARGGFVNGGLIARELGVLAPGRNGYNAGWLTKLSAADQEAFNYCDRTARPGDSVDDADNNAAKKSCNYAISYDHRLRNGGYGFNLYQGTTGITADWSFDLTGSQKVGLNGP
jgi:hypothetical protein